LGSFSLDLSTFRVTPIISCVTDSNSCVLNGFYQDSWLVLTSGKSYASGGMARAAVWLLHSMGESLRELYESNCDIFIAGHSLG
jgi:hypothetical protein